jgi:hypothetical protein
VTPLPSVLAAYTVSVAGLVALGGLAFLAVFGEHVSAHIRPVNTVNEGAEL